MSLDHPWTSAHACRCYNLPTLLQTIFHILPRLCRVIEEEWIPVRRFTDHSPFWQRDPAPVRVYCDSPQLLAAVGETAHGGTTGTDPTGHPVS